MSFEGYYEWKCHIGHKWVSDVYGDSAPPECPRCGGPWVKERLVDQTNVPTEYGRWKRIAEEKDK